MSDPFLGEIQIVGYNFAPRSWADCNGQLLPIAQNTALFSLFGTTFGGDGRTTMGLPDLQGRAAMGQGRGPGLTARNMGQKGGEPTVTLTSGQLGQHNHTVTADNAVTNVGRSPTNAFPANVGGRGRNLYGTASPGTPLKTLANTGGNGAHENMQPYQVLRFVVCLAGVYPARS